MTVPSWNPASIPAWGFTRLLDRIEHLIWGSQDARLRAAGWEVTRIGRWRRHYRHPAQFARLRTALTATARTAPTIRTTESTGTDRHLVRGVR